MDIFKEVKERADILKVCDILGIKLNRNNQALCPLPNHREKTPSFSVLPSKNIFNCFGCGKKGDTITLVAEMLNISPLEAAKFINAHLGLGIDVKPTKESYAYSNRYNQKQKMKKMFLQWENNTFQMLCDYLHLLWKWEEEYKPKKFDEEINDLYVEALQNEDKIQYYIDLFTYGTEEDKMWFKKTNGKVVEKIGRRIRRSNS